jgi:hypothetical protein
MTKTSLAVVAASLLAWLSLGPAVMRAEGDIQVETIKQYLIGKASPLAPSANTFRAQGITYRVDPRLIVAIAGAETTFGKVICGDHNAWNWFWCRASSPACEESKRCSGSAFSSWDEGVTVVTRFMEKSYFEEGLVTIPAIGRKYCPICDSTWVENVTRFYATELGGQPDLRFNSAK